MIDGYDATFTTDISRVKRPTNYSSLAKLFAGFFTFFADFDFSYYVICPKVGGVIPVEEFPAAFELKEGKVFTVSKIQGFHPLKIMENWKMARKIFSRPGKILEFEKKGQNNGEIIEFKNYSWNFILGY